MARNRVADQRRSLLRRLRLHARLAREVRSVLLSADSLDPLHARVAAAVARLPSKDREVLQLVLWDDLSHAEAAAVLGYSANTGELRFRRARARVREALAIVVDRPDVSSRPPQPANGGASNEP